MNYEPVSSLGRWPTPVEPPPFAWAPFALGFLRRNTLVIILCIFATASLGVAYLVTATPRFTASTTLLIDSSEHNLFKQTPSSTDDQTAQNAQVESQLEVLRSDGVAREVVRKLDLANNAMFLDPPVGLFTTVQRFVQSMIYRVTDGLIQTPPTLGPDTDVESATRDYNETHAMQILLGLERAQRIGQSSILELDVQTTSAWESTKLANAIVDAYIKQQFSERAESLKISSVWMEDHLLQLRSQATAADAAVQQYRDKHTLLQTDKGQLDQQALGELATALATAKTRTADSQARYDRIHAVLRKIASQAADPVDDTVDGTNNDALISPIITKLRQQYLDDLQKFAVWKVRYGAKHAAVVGLQNDMEQLRRSMIDELGRIEQSYSSDLKVAQAAQATTEADLAAAISRASSSNTDQVTLHALQSSADTYSQIYQSFLQRYMMASQDQSLPISDVQVVSRATIPIDKSAPQGRLVMGLACVGGLGLGFVIAFLRETFNHGLHSASQVRSATRLDCIGMIPIIPSRELELSRKRRPLANFALRDRILQGGNSAFNHVLDAPLSAFAEAVRQLNVSLLRLLRRGETRVVGCVSAEAGEGKSTLICNLAQLISRSGRKVILLDWDLRKRSLTRALAPMAQQGLFDVATGLAQFRSILFRDPTTGLDFLPAGTPTGSMNDQHANDILGLTGTTRLITELRTIYDVVLIDLPPLHAVADAQGVEHLMDALFMVVEWGKTDRNLVFESLDRLSRGGTRILGLVLNKVDTKRLASFAYASPVSYEPQVMALEN